MADSPFQGLFEGPWLLQGWFPDQAPALAGALSGGGALGMLRVPAFPDLSELEARLERAGQVGLDLKGQLDQFAETLSLAMKRKLPFLAHGPTLPQLPPELKERLKQCGIYRMAFVKDAAEAELAAQDGAQALVVASSPDAAAQLEAIHRMTGLPVLAEAESDTSRTQAQSLLELPGVAGLQLRSPALARELSPRLEALPAELAGDDRPALPGLKIGSVEVPHPIIQGGMGIGVSWEGLAGAVAREGCIGIVSAIGTGNRRMDEIQTVKGRPLGAANLHHPEALKEILQEARRRSEGHGAVGVNILCAINGYEEMVRASVEGGARLIISGAGLPLALPGLVEDPAVALVPIVSSARALAIICRTWERKFHRLPDAVVLEGPESGGHQGFSFEQCGEQEHSLEALLPTVVAERDRWGSFPVIAAGGVWDRSDIERMLALGAGGVQMATRFIATFECDASPAFKTALLRARAEDIRLVKSPVGLPGRAIFTGIHERIEAGEAPGIACISDCVSPCEHGKGARQAGYCIADRLEDARRGIADSGLFFTGSNGWRVRELVSVRELVAELCGHTRALSA